MAENGEQIPELSISGNAPLYRKPEPLNFAQHGKLGLKTTPDTMLSFLKGASYLPCVAAEFAHLSRFYPIVFAGENYMPIAVTGLKEGQNVFVREDGTYEPHHYVPGYARRYPFIFANNPEQGQSVVCLDRAHEAIGENPDIPFFNGEEPTDYLKRTIEFLHVFERDRIETDKLVAFLRELDLFGDMQSDYSTRGPDGNVTVNARVATFRGVPEEKMRELKPEQLQELHKRGYLALIYAHQISLLNWSNLLHRSVERGFVELPTGEQKTEEPIAQA